MVASEMTLSPSHLSACTVPVTPASVRRMSISKYEGTFGRAAGGPEKTTFQLPAGVDCANGVVVNATSARHANRKDVIEYSRSALYARKTARAKVQHSGYCKP